MSENSEKLRGALKSNVQASNDNIFVTGDSVYYKQACDRRWRRPARDLGKGSQQVLVKYGGIYVRCHPCRLALQKQNLYEKKKTTTTTTTTTSYTETDHSESNTAGESNFPALKTNNVASQNIHKETSSDGKTDQPEKDVIEHLSNTKIHTNLKQIWMHH